MKSSPFVHSIMEKINIENKHKKDYVGIKDKRFRQKVNNLL